MIRQKIYMPETYVRYGDHTLSKLFSVCAAYPPADIDGYNFFACSTPIAKLPQNGLLNVYAKNQAEWHKNWDKVNHKPPGKLPRGCAAQFVFYACAQNQVELNLEHVELNGRTLQLSWNIHKLMHPAFKHNFYFAAAIVPKTDHHISASFRYTDIKL